MNIRNDGVLPKHDRGDMPVTCGICGNRLGFDEAGTCKECDDFEESFGENDNKHHLED